MLRVVLAGLFSFGGLLLCVCLVRRYFPKGFGPPWVMGIGFGMVLLILAGVSFFLFNMMGHIPFLSGKSIDEEIAEMDRQGLLTSETFQATRAFQVKEFEDEGLSFYIELTNKTVLFLSGQYLYDPVESTPPTFPCSQFTVKRHKDGYVVEVVRAGKLLSPECVAPSFDEHDLDVVPEDGQIIRDRSYDELKKERLKVK